MGSSFNLKLTCDAIDANSLKDALTPIVAEAKQLAIVCGIGRFPIRHRLLETSTDLYRDVFDSNVLVFLNALAATHHRRDGVPVTFVTLGSVSMMYHYPELGLYNAAKSALRYAVKTASHESAHLGYRFIHINLSTLRQPKELEFTHIEDEEMYLDCNTVARQVREALHLSAAHLNFLEIDSFVPNSDYYEKGYNSRIPRQDVQADPMLH